MEENHKLRKQRKLWKRVGAMIFAPLLFLVMGYSLLYLIGKPVIDLVSSSVQIFLLSEPPTFTDKANADASGKNQSVTNTDEGKIASSSINYPTTGTLYGRVKIASLGVDEPLYFGDSREILRLGAGQYIGSVYPGELGTTMVGAHNNTTFRNMETIEPGTKITIEANYGTYTYSVEKHEVKNYQDPAILAMLAQKDERVLLLYTCYPIYAIGMPPERIFVTAKLISGPIIDETK